MTYDVIVIGLGAMGSAAAYRLAARGQRVLGIERFQPAHDQGSSHGKSRITRLCLAEDPSYAPLMRRSYELYDEVARDSGRTLLTMTGAIIMGRPDAKAITGSLRTAERWGLEHEVLGPDEVRRRFPTLTSGEDEVAVLDPKGGFARPEETVLAHTELAQRAGAELHHGERVTEWSATGDSVQVTTDRGTYSADKLVLCPGAWAPELLDDLGIPFVIERQVMHWFEPKGDLSRFLPENHPVWIWDAPGIVTYGFPAQDGERSLKLAFAKRPVGTTPDAIDREVHPGEVDEIAEHIRRRIPDLPGTHLKAATCMYTCTPDHHFAVGEHPKHPRVVVACGFSGHGFKFVPLIGEVLADLVVDGATAHDIALLDPARLRFAYGTSVPGVA